MNRRPHQKVVSIEDMSEQELIEFAKILEAEMTNEELVKRLVDWSEHDEGKINDARQEAADRIEALTKRLTAMGEQADKDMAFIGDYIIANGNLLAERDALEAKLAKAVDTLMFYGGVMPNAFLPIQDGGEKARATLDDMHRESQ